MIPQLKCAWSPDGTYLAVSHPGSRPSVVIVRADIQEVRPYPRARDPAGLVAGREDVRLYPQRG